MADKLAPPGMALGARRRSSLFELPDLHSRHHMPAAGTSSIFCADPMSMMSEHVLKKPMVQCENTYRMQPPSKFRPDQVRQIIDEVLHSHLENKTYDPIGCSIITKTIAQEIKDKTKTLDFQRYKLVAVVNIGEKKEQGVKVGSRCVWDTAWDNFASGSFENSHIFATAMVYAVYFE